MFRDPKVQGAAALFVLFFIAASIIAYNVPAMQQQYYVFIFMGLGAMYSALLIFVKPDGGNDKPATPDTPATDAGLLSQPAKEN